MTHRMKYLIPSLVACFLSLSANASEARYVTLDPGIWVGTTGVTNAGGTNRLVIAAGETAELVSFPTRFNYSSRIVFATPSGYEQIYFRDQSNILEPLVVTGPSVITLTLPEGYPPDETWPQLRQGYAVFKILPGVPSPDKTIVVPTGAFGTSLQLESSTNLMNWSSIWSGSYSNLPAAQFFRLRLDRAP